jgi:hypothetical protein
VPDRFATGASAIRPTPDTQLSRFHWDRLANSGGKPSFAQLQLRQEETFRFGHVPTLAPREHQIFKMRYEL